MSDSTLHHIFHVTDEDHGMRLDKFLSRQLSETPRTVIQELIKQGQVTSEISTLKLTKPSEKIEKDDRIEIVLLPTDKAIEIRPSPMDIEIVYEDDHLIVLNKSAGVVVHPGAGTQGDTLVNGLMHHTNGMLSDLNGLERPGIVHRLDKDTTGLMVVAKNNETHAALSAMMKKRDIKRHYLALVWGMPNPREGIIDTFYGRDPKNRLKMAVTEDGKQATTHYRVLKPLGLHTAMVECTLETGRTHQIRVHMASIGFPIIGDKTYTNKHQPLQKHLSENAQSALKNLNRQALHAYKLTFHHPTLKNELSFEVPLPKDIQEIENALKS